MPIFGTQFEHHLQWSFGTEEGPIMFGTILLTLTLSTAPAVYEGTWVTTNRPLEGTLQCTVTKLGDDKWRGDFTGEWQRQKFSYTVEFSGPPEKLTGKATIDGASYDWTGKMTEKEFTGKFGGSRYEGSFHLTR
jgi:hypothetical protein